MTQRLPILAAAALLPAAILAAPAAGATSISPAHEFAPHQVLVKYKGARRERAVGLAPGVSVRRAAVALRRQPRVAYAAPNYIATASADPVPDPQPPALFNDLGPLSGPRTVPGGWVSLQWNFLPWAGIATPSLPISAGGIDAIGAWRNLIAAGRPGASGIVVAVLDTGVAYRDDLPGFSRSPDFVPGQFVPGYDFVDHDRLPLDENGHGTHVAGTIAEKTDNAIGLTGLAYRAKLMPVRVLDRAGEGLASNIARGIHFSIAHGADVINMSFNFPCGSPVPGIDRALRDAYLKGVVTVASIGNRHTEQCISPPATGPRAIGVGGTTEGGCLGRYSWLPGKGTDVLAPGGGKPLKNCPSVSRRPIYQVTFRHHDPLHFGEPASYVGTSMAAAHVSGVVAMVLASGVLNLKASPTRRVKEVTERLRHSARDLGLPPDKEGAGLIDAAEATDSSR